jgi:hypothetical protein
MACQPAIRGDFNTAALTIAKASRSAVRCDSGANETAWLLMHGALHRKCSQMVTDLCDGSVVGCAFMRLTPRVLRTREDAIFDALEHLPGDTTFLNHLYRDGAPTPSAYLAQRVRVLFVFREPNMRGVPFPRDMRDEVSDDHFRPIGQDGTRQARSTKCWWNVKAGMFAHAVAAALDGELATDAFGRFARCDWNYAVVNRFAYIQIKKIGGRGTSNAQEICAYAAKYASVLKQQVQLYSPHLVLGCGIGKDSPSRLLAVLVLTEGRERVTSRTGATWWEFPMSARPRAMVQLWHPSWRGKRWTLYNDVWDSVREVANATALGQRITVQP